MPTPGACPWAQATVVQLDEWVGLPPATRPAATTGSGASCSTAWPHRRPGADRRRRIRRRGSGAPPTTSAARGLDLAVLGLGHERPRRLQRAGIAAGRPDPARPPRALVPEAAVARLRGGPRRRPGITVGLARLLEAEEGWLLVTGDRKAPTPPPHAPGSGGRRTAAAVVPAAPPPPHGVSQTRPRSRHGSDSATRGRGRDRRTRRSPPDPRKGSPRCRACHLGIPDGSAALAQRASDSRVNSWSTTIAEAPITPARLPSDERRTRSSRVASGRDRLWTASRIEPSRTSPLCATPPPTTISDGLKKFTTPASIEPIRSPT